MSNAKPHITSLEIYYQLFNGIGKHLFDVKLEELEDETLLEIVGFAEHGKRKAEERVQANLEAMEYRVRHGKGNLHIAEKGIQDAKMWLKTCEEKMELLNREFNRRGFENNSVH